MTSIKNLLEYLERFVKSIKLNLKVMTTTKISFTILILLFFSMYSFSQSVTGDFKIKDSKSSLLKSDLSDINMISGTKIKKQKDFTFSTNIYLWAASISGTSALPLNKPNLPPQTPVAEVSLKFSDAFKYLKFAAMLAGSLRYKSFGLLYDIAYVKLKYDASVPVASTYISAVLTSKTFNVDLDLAYRFKQKNKNIQLDVYAGARISSLDNTLDLYKPNGEVLTAASTKTWVDPLIGGNARIDFSKHWLLYLKGDAGGFGVSSKFTGLILWTVGYKFSKNWNTSLGFKYLYMDYDKDDFLWKVAQYGMLLSFGYMFN